MPERPSLFRRILRAVLFCLLAAALIFVFYVAVVMGQPQEDLTGRAFTPRAAQALPEPLSAAISLADDRELSALAQAFPAPVMYAADDALVFLSGQCADVPFEDGVARVVTLVYRTADFRTLQVESILPARALSLLEDGERTFLRRSADTMADIEYVAMQDATTLRMHAQGEEALYVLTAPLADGSVIRQWTDAMRLSRPDAE